MLRLFHEKNAFILWRRIRLIMRVIRSRIADSVRVRVKFGVRVSVGVGLMGSMIVDRMAEKVI